MLLGMGPDQSQRLTCLTFPGAEESTSPDRAMATAILPTFQAMFAAPAMPSVDAGSLSILRDPPRCSLCPQNGGKGRQSIQRSPRSTNARGTSAPAAYNCLTRAQASPSRALTLSAPAPRSPSPSPPSLSTEQTRGCCTSTLSPTCPV